MSAIAPMPPPDPELQRTIDYIAHFVAKNGPASEEATRQQNFGNPNFSFLYGGEFSDYYKFRLLFEIQNLQKTVSIFMPEPRAQQYPTPSEVEITKLDEEIRTLRKQIEESESNLKAHEVALNVQKQAKVEAIWRAHENKRINDDVKQVGLNIAAFDKHLERLSEIKLSKETISNSKKWIFDNCNSDRLCEIILLYLLHRVREKTATDIFRLHTLYLVNDWAHHCHRKKVEGQRKILSQYVPKLYAYARNSALSNTDLVEKLEKLVGVWEGHKYFDDNCHKQLRNPSAVINAEQALILTEQKHLAINVDKEIAETLGTYEKQHQEFSQHILGKISMLESQLQAFKDKMEAENVERQQKTIERTERRRSRFDQQLPAPPNKIPSLFETTIPPTLPPIKMQQPPPPSSTLQDQQQFPPAYSNANPNLQSLKDVDLTPKAPYYELPAGMMIPLIKLEDITYKPLKEQDLRLPTHEPTNNELIRELDRFYSALQLPPPVDCIRDADGWEFNGLTDHYVKKSEQRMKLETKMKEQGKTIEDAFINKFISHKESTNGDRGRGKASEHTPRPRRKNSSASSSRSSSSSSSTSESSSTSKSSSQKSRSPSPIKRRRVSRSPTPEQRPTFSAGQPASAPRTSISFKVPPNPLDRETNKGAQLMAKMGWEGRGLGSKEQGINEPVEGGEVRDKTEQYRGLGSKPDIYDEYRKQMSTQMAKRIHKF